MSYEKVVNDMEDVYGYAVQCNGPVQMEEEQIYETPCEDDGDYGPIYTEPPTEVEKIYETFEGKSFHKLYHQNIRYSLMCALFKLCHLPTVSEPLKNLVQGSLGLSHVVC